VTDIAHLEQSASAASGLIYIRTTQQAEHCTARNRPFLKATNHAEKRVVYFRPRCKSWQCPYCGVINTRAWAARAYHGATLLAGAGHDVYFLTLTSSPKLAAIGTLKVFPKAWAKLSTRARRSAPEGQYLMVPELHQDGRLHVHALVTWDMDERWWKDNAAQCGLGYMAKLIVVAEPGIAAWYLTKYLSKSLGVAAWPENFRRVRTSQGWPAMPEMPEPEGWTFSKLPKGEALNVAAARQVKAGYEVLVAKHDEAWGEVNPLALG
jgi:hypothetical protein